MGFAIHPADEARGRRDTSLAPAAATTASTPTSSSASSLDGGDDGRRRPRSLSPPAAAAEARAPGHTLEVPSRRHRLGRQPSRPARLFQKLRLALPVLTLTPRCGRLQVGTPSEIAAASAPSAPSSSAGTGVPQSLSFSGAARPCRRVTGTLYGRRKGRVVLALQETPRCLPSLMVELALQTHALLRELGNPAGARIVLETERRAATAAAASDPAASAAAGDSRRPRGGARRGPPLLDEPAWTMFCNGRKTGYAVRREATDDDLTVMETLRAVSMGAGVLPGRSPPALPRAGAQQGPPADDEVPYMRGCFDHFIGSRDSESLYMVAPQGGGTGPELAIFFVRL